MRLINITPNDNRWYSLEDLPNEEWRPVVEYDGLYSVSNYGRIKTIPRRRVKELIKKTEIYKGYERVSLSKNHISKHFFVHQVVAKSFINNQNNYVEINHKNENALDNSATNLEWCEHTYNINYGTRTAKTIDKQRKPVCRFNKNGVLLSKHYSIQQAARDLNINAAPICRACNNKQEYAYGYIWSFDTKEGDM